MGMSVFLIRQVVHEDIWYFSYKIRKGQFLSQAMKDKRKAFEQTQALPPVEHDLVFTQKRKISASIRW